MPLCTCKDIDIHYEIKGEGRTLLLISGLSGGTWSWYKQVPFFEKHFQTIIFDNRGAGLTSMPVGPYSIRQLAIDAACLLDHLKVHEIFLLGLSMGGMIAQKLALLKPDRIQAMVLGCTHCGGSLRVPPSQQVLGTLMNNEGLNQAQIIDKNLPLFFSNDCRRNRPQVVEAYRKVQVEAPLQPEHAFHAQLQAIGNFGCCERLPQIQIPTLIFTGTEDVLVPPPNAHILAERISASKLVECPGAGHAIHAECADQLNQLSLNFFNQQI